MTKWHNSTIDDSKYIELNRCTGRVVPRATTGGYAWSALVGSRNVPFKSGFTKTQAAAKRAAVRSCKAFNR